MENMSRFKKHITATGKITWYFQAFRTTRRGFNSKREAQLAYLEMEKQHADEKINSTIIVINETDRKNILHFLFLPILKCHL